MGEGYHAVFQNYVLDRVAGKQITLQESLSGLPYEDRIKLNEKFAALKVIEKLIQDLPKIESSPRDSLIKESEPIKQATFAGCKLIRKLGQGGMGVVYLAYQEKLRREVVIKVLRPFAAESEALKQRFIRESHIIGHLSHENIVPVYDVGEEEETYYIIMKYVEGVPLSHIIEKISGVDRGIIQLQDIMAILNPKGNGQVSHKNPTEFFCNLMIKVCDAVQYAHDQGVVHRDIKPSNIIVMPNGNPVLVDFGLGQDVIEKSLTLSGEFLGTPIYSAPELFEKGKPQNAHLLDVYSLGVTLYELLTGGVPYEGESIYEIFSNIKSREPLRPQTWWKGIPRDLEIIILKLLEKDPRSRYSSATALKQDLERFFNYQPIEAKPPSVNRVVSKWVFRHRLGVAIAMATIVIASSTFIFGVHIKSRWDIAKNKIRLTWSLKEYDLVSALISAQSLVEINPTNHEFLMTLAQIQYLQGQYEDAIGTYNRVAALDPKNFDIYLNLAGTYYRLEKLDDAQSALQRALELAPNNFQVLRYMGSSYILLGNYDQAIDYLSRAIDVESDYLKLLSKQQLISALTFNASTDLALAYSFQKNYDRAVSTLKAKLSLYPNHQVMHKVLINILEKKDDRIEILEQKNAMSKIPSLALDIDRIGHKLFIPFGWFSEGTASIYGKGALLTLVGVPRVPSELIDKPEIIIYQADLIRSRQELLKLVHSRVTKFGGSILDQKAIAPHDNRFTFYELTSGYALRNRPAMILTAVENSGDNSTIYALVSQKETFEQNRHDFEWMLSNLKPIEKEK